MKHLGNFLQILRSIVFPWILATVLFVVFGSVAQADSPEIDWLRQFGSEGATLDLAEAADSDGNIYVAGFVGGALPGNNSAGGFDAFVRKYDANGNEIWTRQFGTAGNDEATGIAVHNGWIYVVGYTNGAFAGETNAGGVDAFVRKYSVGGDAVWTRQFGIALDDKASGVFANDTGVYVVGWTDGALSGHTSAGEDDGFIRKYDVSGNVLWTDQFGSAADDRPTGVSGAGTSIYVAGLAGAALPGQSHAGADDAFVRKYDVNGTDLWTRQFGTSTSDLTLDVAADANAVYISGATLGQLAAAPADGFDAYVRKLSSDGDEVWTKQFGTHDTDVAASVTLHSSGVYIAGYTGGSLAGQSNAGDNDSFVRKYDAGGSEIWTRQFGTKDTDMAFGVTADDSGVYALGFTDTLYPDQPSGEWDDTYLRKFDHNGNEQWESRFGTVGPQADTAHAVDSDGNVYVAGSTGGDLPGQTNAGAFDAYVRKYDANGIEIWTRQFGTDSTDLAFGVALDGTGVYVVGLTGGTLPNQIKAGAFDAFIRKYDFYGNQIWTRQFGTVALDVATAVVADGTGVYVTGSTSDAFPGHTNQGEIDLFVRKYDADGNEVWTSQEGSPKNDIATSVDVDGSIYVAGFTAEGNLAGQALGLDDAFVFKFDSNGVEEWRRQFGTPYYDMALGVSANSTGVYVGGATVGPLALATPLGGFDAFVRKYDVNGSDAWTKQFGTPANDMIFGVTADAGGVNVAGVTGGTLNGQTSAGGEDAFVRKYTADGSDIWTRQFGTLTNDTALGLSIDTTGLYAVGLIGGELLASKTSGEGDAFVAKIGSADLVLAKSGPSTVVAGEEIEYTVTLTNKGPATARSVVVEDALPVGLTLVESTVQRSGSGNALCGGTSCSLGDVAINETITIQIRATVDPDLAAGTILENTATVFSDTPDPNEGDNTATATTEVTSQASLTITKDDLWDEVLVQGLGDDSAVYLINVQNDGPSTARNVVVKDKFPGGMTLGEAILVDASYASAPSSCGTAWSSPAICELGDIPAGESLTLHVVTFVNASVTGCDTYVNNVAELSWEDSAGGGFLSTETRTRLTCQGDLDLKKKGPSEASVGDTITYVITTTNTGPSLIPAGEVTLEDQLPSGLTGGTIVSESGSCQFGVGTSSPWTNGGDFVEGDACVVEIEATITEDVCPAGIITNEAQIHDQDSNIDQALWLTQVNCDTTLAISKTVPGGTQLTAGSTVSFDIAVTNNGNVTAYGTELTDNLVQPSTADARIVDMAIDSTSFGYTPTGGECTDGGFCNLPDIPVGETVNLIASVEIDADAEGSLEQRACAEADNASATCDAATGDIVSEATLALAKSDGGATLAAGGDGIRYTITLENAGPSDARDVVIEDTPQAPSFNLAGDLEPSLLSITCTGGSCTIPVLRAGQTVQIYATLEAGADTQAGTYDANQVCVTEARADVVDLPCAVESTDVVADADVSLRKKAPSTVNAGDSFTYVVSVANSGPSNAQNVRVTDTLPQGVTLNDVSISAAGATCNDTNPVTCSVATLAAGDSFDVSIDVTAANDLQPGSSLENNASVESDTPDSNAANNSDDADTSILDKADLSISKESDVNSVNAGETIAYTILVTNNGPSTAHSVVVQDALPSGMSLVSATVIRNGESTECGGVTCQLGDVAVDEVVRIDLVARVASGYTGDAVTNQVEVFSDANDPQPDNNTATETTAVTQLANLAITKRGSTDPAVPGTSLTYYVDVTNRGPSNAANVTVRDDLPPGFTATSVSSSQRNCNALPCNLGTLSAGGSATVRIVGDVAANVTEALVNTASASSTTPLVNDNVQTSLTTSVRPEADLVLTKVASATVGAGEMFLYTLTVVNNGPSDAQNVAVTDALPDGVTLNSVNTDADGGTCDSADPVTCSVGTLAAGGSFQVTIEVVAAGDLEPGSSVENSASVSADTIDSDTTNNSDDADTSIVGKADLALSKTGPESVIAGTSIEYTMVVMNHGPSTAHDVRLEDALPEGVRLERVTVERAGADPTPCGSTVCTIGSMAVGEEVTVRLEATVGSGVAEGRLLENRAVVLSSTRDAVSDNNSATAQTMVEVLADLEVVKIDLTDPVEPTAGFVYDIAVTNLGPSNARSVVITDQLGEGLTFSAIGPSCNADGQTVTCSLGQLTAGATARYLLAANAGDLPNGTELTNNVEVSSSTPDPDNSNNSDEEVTTVQQKFGASADLHLHKAAAVESVQAGEQVSYTIQVTNTGPVDATNVQLLELVPSGTELISITAEGLASNSVPCNGSGDCYLGTVPAGTVITINAVLRVDESYADGFLTNLVTVFSDQMDPHPDSNIGTSTIEVIPFTPVPKVTVSKQLVLAGDAADGIVTVDQMATFVIEITNTGDVTLIDLPLEETYDPDILSFVEANPAPDIDSEGTLTWSDLLSGPLSLAPGDSLSIAIEYRAVGSSASKPDGKTVTSTAVRGAVGENGFSSSEVRESASIKVTTPSVVITTTLDDSTSLPVAVGESIVFEVLVENDGDTKLVTIPLQFLFDSNHLAFESASIPPSVQNEGELLWDDVGDLAPGESTMVTLHFTVTGSGSTESNVNAESVTDENGDPVNAAGGLAAVQVRAFSPSTFLPWIANTPTEVYRNDFSQSTGPTSSHAEITVAPNGERFLGELGNESITLNLTNLPDHSWAKLTFDLYVIRSWDGSQVQWPEALAVYANLPRAIDGEVGPDRWMLNVDGQRLIDTTFANIPEFQQAYPDGNHPAQTEAVAINELGYHFNDRPMDAVYRIERSFAHDDRSMTIEFSALGLQPLDDESWGIDNVSVAVGSAPSNATPANE